MADLSQFLTDEIAGDVKPSTGVPDPVPPGDYDLQQSESDVVQTKDKSGLLLICTFEILTGQYEGRKIFTQFNIANKSAQAQQIGIAEFKALCLATGVSFEEARMDTSSLDYKPFKAKIGFDKEQINPTTGLPYAPKNRITKFFPHGEAAAHATPANAPAAHVAAAATAASKPAGAAKRPWEK